MHETVVVGECRDTWTISSKPELTGRRVKGMSRCRRNLIDFSQAVVPLIPNLMGTGGRLAFLDFRVKRIHQTGSQPAPWTQMLLFPAQSPLKGHV